MTGNSTAKPQLYYGWYIVATAMFIAFVTTGARNSFGIFVIPMSEEFDWNRTTISIAAAIGWLVNGITQPFVGNLFDRFNGRKIIITSLIVVGLATMALSLTFHFLFLVFIFGFVMSTAMSGASQGTLGPMLTRWFRRKRGTVLGMNVAGASLGGLILIPFGAYLLDVTDWRTTWIALGLIILVLAVPLAFIFIRNNPAEMGLQPDGDPDPLQGAQQERRPGPFEVERWKESFKSPPMWQLSAAYTVCGVTTGIISTHFVPYAEDVGVSQTMAAVIFGYMMGLNVLGGIGAGMIADRFGRKNVLGTVYLVRGLAYVLLVAMPGATSLWVFATLAGFSWIASVPVTTSLTADVYGLRALGTITGISFLCHQVGAFLSILLAGVLFDATGSYTLPFAIAGSLLFPAALAAFSINERKYSIRYQAPVATAAAGD
jgi:MFS family permease